MSPFLPLATLLGALLLVAGCDNHGTRDLHPGVSTLADVRARMGEPVAEWPNRDGSLTLEYPKGPEGHVTFMVTVDAGGHFQGAEQVLTEAHFARIAATQTQQAVRRLLGRPSLVERFDQAGETVWSWRIEGPAGAVERHYFNVHFGADGTVRRTSRSMTPLR